MDTTYDQVVPGNGKKQRVKLGKMDNDKLMCWAQDYHQLLQACDPNIPGLYNRKTDTWRLVVAIANLAGGRWLQRVKAVVALLAANGDEPERTGMILLGDMRQIFKQAK